MSDAVIGKENEPFRSRDGSRRGSYAAPEGGQELEGRDPNPPMPPQRHAAVDMAGGANEGEEAPKRTRSYLQRIGVAPIHIIPGTHQGYDEGDQPQRSPTGAIRQHSGLVRRRVSKIKDKDGKEQLPDVEEGEQWHALSVDEIFAKLGGRRDGGLTAAEHEAALTKNGANLITPPKKTHIIIKFLKTLFCGGFQLMMFAGSIMSFVVFALNPGDIQTLALAVMLIVVVVATTVFQTYQEGKSDDTMDALRAMTADTVYVVRDGSQVQASASSLVPGDLVYVKGGEKVPADLRILESADLKVNNASLTGENIDIKLGPDPMHSKLFEAKNIARSGCNFTNGTGLGVVFATGDHTFFGQIASSTTSIERPDTLMKREIHRLILIMGIFATVLGITFFLLSFFTGYKWYESVSFAIAIIVANVPEGLLPQLTVALTLTAKRLKTQDMLVSNLEIIETLGAVTTICSDKTGTLTENRMTVSHIVYDGKMSRSAQAPPEEGDVPLFDAEDAGFQRLQRCASLNSDAAFLMDSIPADKQDIANVLSWPAKGDATEIGLIKYLHPLRDLSEYRKTCKREFCIPFNSTNKWMLSIASDEPDAGQANADNKPLTLMVKGAPEKVMAMCSSARRDGKVVPLDDAQKQHLDNMNYLLGSRGERVIGLAERELDRQSFPPGFVFDGDSEIPNFPMDGLTFLGFVSLIDPPRAAVPAAVADCSRAGIQVFMVTGDQPVTALAIARSIGLVHGETRKEKEAAGTEVAADPTTEPVVVHGTEELVKFTQADWDRTLQHKEIVFARTMPQQKQDIVTQLSRKGHIVAMTGDGVNDAPALKAAHVGVAMGSGTSVAKEAAQCIATKDDFGSIVCGVREGRLIFDNLKKCIAYVLSSNIPEIIPFLLFVAAKLPLSMETIAILCIDLGTDVLPAIALAYEDPEDAIMQRRPRTAEDHLVGPQLMLVAYGTIGMFQTVGAFFAFFYTFSDYGWSMGDMWGQSQRYRNTVTAGQAMEGDESNAIVRFRHWCGNNTKFIADHAGGNAIPNPTDPDYFKKAFPFDQTCQEYRVDVMGKAQSAYFMAVVYSQYANVLIRKTQVATIFTVYRMWHNKMLLFSFITEFIVMMAVTHIPGLNDKAFGMKMPDTKHAVCSLWIIPFIIAWDEARKAICRKWPNGPIARFTYF